MGGVAKALLISSLLAGCAPTPCTQTLADFTLRVEDETGYLYEGLINGMTEYLIVMK